MSYWLKWSCTGYPIPHLNANSHALVYARQYASRASCDQAETIRLIRDFKICPISSPEKLDRKHRAIQCFAEELAHLLKNLRGPWYITHIPTSKTKDSREYDDRFEQVIKLVTAKCENIIPVTCFTRKSVTGSLHNGEGVRDPKHIGDSWLFTPPTDIDNGLGRILIVDDVVTSGASMRAAFDAFSKLKGQVVTIGVAWALTRANNPIPPDMETDADSLEALAASFEILVTFGPKNDAVRRALLAWINSQILQPIGIQPVNTDLPIYEAKAVLQKNIEVARRKAWNDGFDAGKNRL